MTVTVLLVYGKSKLEMEESMAFTAVYLKDGMGYRMPFDSSVLAMKWLDQNQSKGTIIALGVLSEDSQTIWRPKDRPVDIEQVMKCHPSGKEEFA